ncbi:MAG: M23 family metallopeptidase [bacterium]|nr:M23 family metallopeptidase [bacterium]
MKRILTWLFSLLAVFFCVAAFWPVQPVIPVQGATRANWIAEYFWNCPWCKGDRVHYGIDIIYKRGTPIIASTPGLVVWSQPQGRGGEVVMVIGPGWKLHYYAHLDEYRVQAGEWVEQGQTVGLLGNTGASDLPHLHYTIFTPLPRFWRWDGDKFGYRKMFFLDPTEELAGATPDS